MALVKCKECGADVSSKAAACPKCGAKPTKKTSIFTWVVLVVTLIAAWAMITGESGLSSSSSTTAAAGSSPSARKAEALKGVELKSFQWERGGFEAVMVLKNIVIENRGKAPVKDLTITCEGTSNSGSVIDINRRQLFEVVAPGKPARFRELNMGLLRDQVQRVGCRVTDLALVDG